MINFKSTIESKIDKLESLRNEYSEDISIDMAFAEYNFIHGNRLKAICAYQDILKKDESALSAGLNLAVLFMLGNFINEGFSEFLKLMKKDPSDLFSYFFCKFYSDKYEVPKELKDEFSVLTEFTYSFKEIELFLNRIESIIDLISLEESEYKEISLKESSVLAFQYMAKLASDRKSEFSDIYNYVLDIKNSMIFKIKAEKEAKILEEKRRFEEEEAARLAEEQRIREEKERAEEEERRRIEEERRRIEEEQNRENEIIQRYAELSKHLEPELVSFAKNKGVIGVALIDRSGRKIASVINESMAEDKFADFANRAISIITDHRASSKGNSLLYWVLEFENGLIAIRLVDSERALLMGAGVGATFGILRYAMEKTKENIIQVLSAHS